MGLILNIETTTFICSVALSKNGEAISLKENKQNLQHGRLLTVFINQILKENKIQAIDLDAVAISAGPGSFTGLRIGTAVAKGFCYATGIPLIAINTLEALVQAVIPIYKNEKNTLFCPIINLRGVEIHAALFNKNNQLILEPSIIQLHKESFSSFLKKHKIYFFGTGFGKCKQFLTTHSNAKFLPNINASAAYMSELSEKTFNQKKFQDIAYFSPNYLKDFVPTKPKKMQIILSNLNK